MIEVVGEARVFIHTRTLLPRSFGLTFGRCSVLHDVKSGEEGEEAEEEALRMVALETLTQLLSRRLAEVMSTSSLMLGMASRWEWLVTFTQLQDALTNRLQTLKKMTPAQLSMWLISALRAEHSERHRWLAMTHVVQRLRAQIQVRVCLSACICLCLSVCPSVRLSVCLSVRMPFRHTHTHTQVHVCVCVRARAHACMRISLRTQSGQLFKLFDGGFAGRCEFPLLT